jgi:hypothetical protein
MTMLRNPKVRKSIYALSAVIIPLLVVVGVPQHEAAVYVAAAVAVANVVMAFLNVPGDEDE